MRIRKIVLFKPHFFDQKRTSTKKNRRRIFENKKSIYRTNGLRIEFAVHQKQTISNINLREFHRILFHTEFNCFCLCTGCLCTSCLSLFEDQCVCSIVFNSWFIQFLGESTIFNGQINRKERQSSIKKHQTASNSIKLNAFKKSAK